MWAGFFVWGEVSIGYSKEEVYAYTIGSSLLCFFPFAAIALAIHATRR